MREIREVGGSEKQKEGDKDLRRAYKPAVGESSYETSAILQQQTRHQLKALPVKMKRLILGVLAIALLAQAVVSLECYYCPYGGNCFSTQTCSNNQDRCITIFNFLDDTYASRCATQYECEVLQLLGGSALKAICCSTNQCNG